VVERLGGGESALGVGLEEGGDEVLGLIGDGAPP